MMYALSLLWLVTSPAGIDGAAPFTEATFDEACSLAEAQAKQVLIYFSDPETAHCKAYRELTWPDKKVQRWIQENTTAIEAAGERAEDLRKRFEVRLLPTVLIVSPDGVVRARVVGFRDAENLLDELESTLQASDQVALALRRIETNSKNPAALLMYARTLAEAGRVDEALLHYKRSFELGSDSVSGFGGVQLVVVDELGRLAVNHRAARKALLERRNASRARLLHGQGERSDPTVLAAANAWLDDLDDTLFVVARLRTERPDSLMYRLLRECAVDSAVKIRDYQHIPEVIDIVEHADRAFEQFEQDRKRVLPAGANIAKFRIFERRAFVERTARYYEMLVGTGKLEEAERLAEKLLAVDGSTDALVALARAGLRTGMPGEANIKQARRAVELDAPPGAEAVSTLVEILLRLDRREQAAQAVEKYGPKLADGEDRARLKRLLQPQPED